MCLERRPSRHRVVRHRCPPRQSVGNVYGFNLTDGASDVLLTGRESSGATAGVHLNRASSRNTVSGNSIHDNGVLTSFGLNRARDLGAWGCWSAAMAT